MRAIGPIVRPLDMRTARTPPKVADSFYHSPEWKALRAATFKRDGYRCVLCGKPAIVADHIKSRRRWIAEGLAGSPDTLENLRALCRDHDNRFKEDASGDRRGGAGGRVTPAGALRRRQGVGV